MKILGLDISTSVTGLSVLEAENKQEDPRIILLDKIEFKSGVSFWEKTDHAYNFITNNPEFLSATKDLDAIYVEESLQSFRTGMSSAATITTLAKFNSMVSYFVRQKFGIDPTYIAATSARKTCGIKIQKTAVCGKNAKDQTFEWAMAGPLKHVEWPKKKNGDPKDWSKDAVDAYVVARSGIISSLR